MRLNGCIAVDPAAVVFRVAPLPFSFPPASDAFHRMVLRWFFASLHLLALGIGLGAIWARSRAFLHHPFDRAALQRALSADAWWAAAAVLWLSTGVIRGMSGLDKGPEYYVTNRFFQLKMALFLAVVVMEIRPMRAALQWRGALRRGEPLDTADAPAFGRTSAWQAFLVVAMLLAASAMARGLGMS